MDSVIFQPPEPDPEYLARKDYRESPVPHIYMPARNARPKRAPTVVHYHGNATDCHQMSAWARRFTYRGYNVMLVEYPGYGPYQAEGPDRSHVHSDIEILARSLLRNGKYHVIGQSIGTGPASELAKKLVARGMKRVRLTLITPYTSLAELSGDYVPIPVLDLFTQIGMWALLPYDFPTLQNAAGLRQDRIQVDVHHGTDDEIIPYYHARRFGYNKCDLSTYPCSHNDILSHCTDFII